MKGKWASCGRAAKSLSAVFWEKRLITPYKTKAYLKGCTATAGVVPLLCFFFTENDFFVSGGLKLIVDPFS